MIITFAKVRARFSFTLLTRVTGDMMNYRLVGLFVVFALLLSASGFLAAPPLPDGTEAATKAMAKFKVPAGIKVDLFAAEPKLGNPVAICLDEQGRVYVAEEYRFNLGTEENRTRPFLLEDDLQIKTVEDRLKTYKKWAYKFDGGMDWFSKYADQVRLLEDRDGDGKADVSTIFAGGFNDPLEGLAAGVLAYEGNVYFTCIPHLWLLRDEDGDGKADVRLPLQRGFGVNCAYLGHDLHGLTWGPDGKLYFSVGDRGFHIDQAKGTKEGKVLSGPRSGAVFRCNSDGSDLEVVATGLRNPQELAFDQYGNLFADDNNCDKGDDARLVFVVEGGDSGWNMSNQTIPAPYLTGPWHAERMWHLPHKGQPAWIVPPVGKLGVGPSGFLFTSGISLPERYRNRFFMCNYTGNGGIESFGVKPKGAGFEIVDYHDFFKPIQATDVEMGYDGKLYVSDFINLIWEGGSKGGRIYTVFDSERLKDPVVQEVKKLFKEGFRQRPPAELGKLLGHPDQRVRLRAQFVLAGRAVELLPQKREREVVEILQSTALSSPNQLARLHAIWGLGQIPARGMIPRVGFSVRKVAEIMKSLEPLLEDQDAEVRAQTAKVIGETYPTMNMGGKVLEVPPPLLKLLKDDSPRVRFFAALALGKLKDNRAIDLIFDMLKENDDPFLRHAGVMALTWIGDRDAVQERAKDKSAAVRMAVLLTYRRWQDLRITQFVLDSELDLVTEAARALHDLSWVAHSPQPSPPREEGEEANEMVAKLLDRYASSTAPDVEPLLRRAISAHYRLGKEENVRAVARAAANPNCLTKIRAEAIAALRDWADPPPRDRVTGFWHPLPKRDVKMVQGVLEEVMPHILSTATGSLVTDTANLVAKLNIKMDDTTFFQWVADPKREISARTAGLRLLAQRKFPDLDKAIDLALQDGSPRLRAEARDVLADKNPDKALSSLQKTLDDTGGSTLEKQQALATLARMKKSGARKILDGWAEKLSEGKVAAELQLDLLEALKAIATEPAKQAIQKFESSQVKSDPLAKYCVSLQGGDAERGREIFVGHAIGQCMRCHTINGATGAAGPDLAKVVERNPTNTREHILESLILPNAKISPGFGSVVLTLTSGKTLAGAIQAEGKDSLTLTTPEGKTIKILKKEIDEQTPPNSAMPSMEKSLSLREIRDVIEFLATLR